MYKYSPKIVNYKPKIDGGFGLIEIVIAAAVIATALYAVMTVARTSLELNRRVLFSTRAGFLLEEGSEGIRMLRDANWANLSGLTVGTSYYLVFSDHAWQSTTSPSVIDGIFTRTFKLGNVYRDGNDDIAQSGTLDPSTKQITENVSWWNGNATSTRELFFYLTDLFSD